MLHIMPGKWEKDELGRKLECQQLRSERPGEGGVDISIRFWGLGVEVKETALGNSLLRFAARTTYSKGKYLVT